MAVIQLHKISTRAPKELDKVKTKEETAKIMEEFDDLQNLLYAESKHSVLVVIQGMDASGKDGLIRDVFGEFNPQGVMVTSYKAPTDQELSHDFLWRIHQHAPSKGMIQVFNRSHYEDIMRQFLVCWCFIGSNPNALWVKFTKHIAYNPIFSAGIHALDNHQ